MSLSGRVSSKPSTNREPASARNETSSDDFETLYVQASTKPGTLLTNVYLFISQPQPSSSRERMARFRKKKKTELERAERRTRDRE